MKRLLIALTILCMVMTSLVSCVHEHSYGEWTVNKSATVLSDGIERRTCECGEFEDRIINKIGLENALQGRWISEENATVYLFLDFEGSGAKGGIMIGDKESMVSLISSYGIEGDELVLRFDSEKEYGRYSIIDKGSYVKLFYEGEEYKKVD